MERRKMYQRRHASICADARHRVVNKNVELHWHDCCEVELVLAGRGTHVINGHAYPMEPGDLYFFTPADCHSIVVEESVEVLGIMFDDGLMSDEIYTNVLALEMTGADMLTKLSVERQAVVKNYFGVVVQELCAESCSNQTTVYLEHLLDCIAIELLRGMEQEIGTSKEKQPMKEAILYLHRRYAEPITLATLADHVHLTPSYLSTYFKTNVGRSFKDYLIELRLRHACRLLVNTEWNVTDICYHCGFSSYPNFARSFRAHYEISPMQFRRQHQV